VEKCIFYQYRKKISDDKNMDILEIFCIRERFDIDPNSFMHTVFTADFHTSNGGRWAMGSTVREIEGYDSKNEA